MCAFVYLQTVRDFPLRPNGDATEPETHQAAVVEVMELHQCELEHREVLKQCQ